jgi:hypothetical protein
MRGSKGDPEPEEPHTLENSGARAVLSTAINPILQQIFGGN